MVENQSDICYNFNMSKFALINAQKAPSKQLERAKRQAILMRIVSANPDATQKELAAKMREDPWVAARWPAYSIQTVSNDFEAGIGLVKDDIRDIAMPYLARNIALSDDVIQTLVEFVNNDNLGEKLRIDAANAVRAYLDQSNKVFGTYAPKEMHIRKAEVQVNLDNFLIYQGKEGIRAVMKQRTKRNLLLYLLN
jgi:hypothetical protein